MAAKDAAGNALAANFTWSFTTGLTLLLTPGLGAHNLAYYPVGNAFDPISTASMSTQTSGSTILACVGRGTFADFSSSLPTDSKNNTPYIQQDTAHAYNRWPNSGTALYAFPSAVGGNGHAVQTANPSKDEITLAVVEVINGGVIQDVKWIEKLSLPHTSQSVTTTGPATLVAFWWGDDDGGSGNVTATPDQGFTVIDSQLVSQQAVECVVATKNVSAAGSYNVTWTDTPAQGAQLWLVAVQ
jgi:hypothetical protein